MGANVIIDKRISNGYGSGYGVDNISNGYKLSDIFYGLSEVLKYY
jgi:hypothetical protein